MSRKPDRRTFLVSVSGGLAGAAAMGRGTSEGVLQSTPGRAAGAAEDLCFMSARDLATMIRTRKVSAREVMTAHLARINRLNPKINAIVARLGDERCLALADAADERVAK